MLGIVRVLENLKTKYEKATVDITFIKLYKIDLLSLTFAKELLLE